MCARCPCTTAWRERNSLKGCKHFCLHNGLNQGHNLALTAPKLARKRLVCFIHRTQIPPRGDKGRPSQLTGSRVRVRVVHSPLQGYLIYENAPPQDPIVGLCLGSWGGPRGLGVFLSARYPCTVASPVGACALPVHGRWIRLHSQDENVPFGIEHAVRLGALENDLP